MNQNTSLPANATAIGELCQMFYDLGRGQAQERREASAYMTGTRVRAYDEGVTARGMNTPYLMCPFAPFDSDLRSEWQRGYNDMDSSLRMG